MKFTYQSIVGYPVHVNDLAVNTWYRIVPFTNRFNSTEHNDLPECWEYVYVSGQNYAGLKEFSYCNKVYDCSDYLYGPNQPHRMMNGHGYEYDRLISRTADWPLVVIVLEVLK
jgi:hypothetical protein